MTTNGQRLLQRLLGLSADGRPAIRIRPSGTPGEPLPVDFTKYLRLREEATARTVHTEGDDDNFWAGIPMTERTSFLRVDDTVFLVLYADGGTPVLVDAEGSLLVVGAGCRCDACAAITECLATPTLSLVKE